MANLVYKRVSTDQQSTARQDLVLAEAGIEDAVVFEEDPGTSSRLHPLQRPKFAELLTYARPGSTVHISEMFRLVRGNQHILDVLHRDRLALRIHDGAFSAMDLTARHPRTGELLSTVKFMVQTLAAAGELQRDLLPDHTASEEDAPAAELPVALDMPGKVADYLRTTELEPAERAALDQGVAVRRGQGYTLRVTTVPAVHRQLLARCQPLDGGQGAAAVPAQRKARREYESRVSALTTAGP
ncbi:recombinase family protein [Streptomyces albidoflavus]